MLFYVGGGVLVGWFSVAIVDEMETHERKARPHSASSAAIIKTYASACTVVVLRGAVSEQNHYNAKTGAER